MLRGSGLDGGGGGGGGPEPAGVGGLGGGGGRRGGLLIGERWVLQAVPRDIEIDYI